MIVVLFDLVMGCLLCIMDGNVIIIVWIGVVGGFGL